MSDTPPISVPWSTRRSNFMHTQPRSWVSLQRTACLSIIAVLAGSPLTGLAGDGPVRINRVSEVIDRWTPDQHLFVKGDLGIGERQLANLEEWLDENGKHWTVVLMKNAAGETYVATDARVFQGMDGVEYALGHGLPNRTPFGELEHPATGETDGAIFVLFYNERKMSYFSSDAQDRRGLGQSHWMNELDRPAFRAMRGGERMIDAAKETVSSINAQLEKRIASEEADRKLQERERARAVVRLRMAMEAARKDITTVVQRRDAFLSLHAEASGELAKPPVDDWNARFATIDDKLAPQNVRTVTQELDSLTADISRYLNGFADSDSLDEEIAKIKAQMERQGMGPNEVAAPLYRKVRAKLEQIKSARDQGDLALSNHFKEVAQTVETATAAIANEEQRVARAAARNRLIRNTAIGTSSIVGLGLAGFLVFLNRRRAPAKARALHSFNERRTSVKEEMDNVLGLFTRSNEVLGSKDKVERRGYVGETDQLSDATFESVDDLLIMSNEVERVMGEANEMLDPSNPLDRVVNVFSASHYERAVNHISGEPLTFHRDRGLPSVFEPEYQQQVGNQASSDQGEGDEPSDTITMTFEKVFTAFRKRCNDANATLDQLEQSLLTTNDELTTLQAELEAMASMDRILHESADDDGFFLTPNLFEVLIPSAQTDYDEADRISATDPVLASRIPIPSGRRKVADARRIAEATQTARRKIFPILDERRASLAEQGYQTDWIEENVLALGHRANELYEEAAKGDIADEADAFENAIETFGKTAVRCDKLAKDLDATLTPSVAKLKEAITAGRETISNRLKISKNIALKETNYVPDDRLAFAHEQLQACRAAIHRGNAAAAEDAALAARESLTDGHSIIDDSLAALDSFEELLRKRSGRHTTIEERIPKLRSRLEAAHEAFADSALVFRSADPAFPDVSDTVDTALADAAELNQTSKINLQEAETFHKQGRVLQSLAILEDVERMATESISRFDDIENHLTSLNNRLASNNREIDQALGRAESLHKELNDPRTTRPTMDRYEKLAGEVESIRKSLSAGVAKRDPFAEAKPMLALRERLDQLEAHLVGDKNAHAEATRAVRGAETQRVTARRLVEQASSDGIPDSQTTTKCVREIRDLESSLSIAAQRLDAPHDQWQEVDAEAARIHAALGVSTGRLQGELESAQRTVESFRRASQDVLQATRWAGPFGIRVAGSPGVQELERARALLNSGDYGSVMQMVHAAMMASQAAVQQAEREVARRRREQSRQAEEARRRRMRSSSIGGGGTFGGAGNRSISRPIRSFSRPSPPKTSGFSRSGW